jgi:membrane protease YdiL (CAAX protease family)
VAIGVAAVCSALLFSLVHHLGPLGEPISAGPLLYRFFAGLFFVALFKLRNFAVAVYTHTIYDVFVLVFG